MSMSKKNYIEVARIISEQVEPYKDIRQEAPQIASVIMNIQNELADIFEQDNPRFDRTRFYSACGI